MSDSLCFKSNFIAFSFLSFIISLFSNSFIFCLYMFISSFKLFILFSRLNMTTDLFSVMFPPIYDVFTVESKIFSRSLSLSFSFSFFLFLSIIFFILIFSCTNSSLHFWRADNSFLKFITISWFSFFIENNSLDSLALFSLYM